jgi:type VI secretion system protein ImpL
MTIRRLLFILFLYILLVWIVAAYLYFGDPGKVVSQGLLWMAIGIAALLLWLILERVIGWWRTWRIQKAAKPVSKAAQPVGIHEDDAALVSLLNEADQRLAQAPPSALGARPTRALDLPLYLVVGPERAGKTAILQNSGIEATLLAGQVLEPGAPLAATRVANLWLAQQSLFLEVSGRVFATDAARLTEFLSHLQPGAKSAGWRRWFQPSAPPVSLRGVLLIFDSQKFAGTPEPSELGRSAQQIRERLYAISGVFGAELPVYVLFTRIDGLRYFPEFFFRLPEGEIAQVLGVLTAENQRTQVLDRTWAEAETKRLSQAFQTLFLRLSDRRLQALSQESKATQKPPIYEFPREFKRIRTHLVQFLVDIFKPDPLKSGPLLRGYFFAGIRKTERLAPTPVTDAKTSYRPASVASEATQIFSAEMLTSFGKPSPDVSSGHLVDQWVFLKDFFYKVLRLDRPAVRRAPARSKLDPYYRIAAGAALGLTLFLALVWTISWSGNSHLAAAVESASAPLRRASTEPTLTSLRALDRLRGLLEDLDSENPLRLHWGLYIGDALRDVARRTYFERLKRLSLDQLNARLVSHLEQSGVGNPPEGTTSIYDRLKTHRTITSLGCLVDRALVSKVLKAGLVEVFPGIGDEQSALLNSQLDYYVSQLDKHHKVPVALTEDPIAEEKARAYIRQASGLDQRLRSLLAELDQQIRPLQVADFAENYRAVLAGPAEFRGAFTKNGLTAFQDLLTKGNFGSGEEACVMGATAAITQQALDLETKNQLSSLYYRQYADAWRQFLQSYSVIRYSGVDDAARRLNILAGPTSPLLGIVRLVAVNTSFPPPKPGEQSVLDKVINKAGFGSSKAKADKASDRVQQFLAGDARMTTADLAKLFQPVLFTAPPDLDRLVNDNNIEYVKGLRGLQQNLDALARASAAERMTAIPQARTAFVQARAARAALADKFLDVGNQGLNRQLADLLEQPIRLADPWIPPNTEAFSGAKKNGELAQFCRDMHPILAKYPFNSSAESDATLNDLSTAFSPTDGLVWKYVQKSAADLAVRHGTEWLQNPALQGMKVAPDLLSFLGRSQQLTDVFFAEGGMMQAKLKYVLRPVPGQTIAIRLMLDGSELSSQNPLQKTFYWPALAGATPGAIGTVEAGGFSTGFGRFDGLWGVFRLFQNADPRPLGSHMVTWSEIRGRGGAEPQKLNPPAKVEFVDFPGGFDLFNRRFFDELRCPNKAVIVN